MSSSALEPLTVHPSKVIHLLSPEIFEAFEDSERDLAYGRFLFRSAPVSGS